jgi:hypothetical protein
MVAHLCFGRRGQNRDGRTVQAVKTNGSGQAQIVYNIYNSSAKTWTKVEWAIWSRRFQSKGGRNLDRWTVGQIVNAQMVESMVKWENQNLDWQKIGQMVKSRTGVRAVR